MGSSRRYGPDTRPAVHNNGTLGAVAKDPLYLQEVLKPRLRQFLAYRLNDEIAALRVRASRNQGEMVQRPAEDEWSLTEILCHLRDTEGEVNLPRVQTIISEDNPLVQGVDTDVWAQERRYIRQDGPQALADFSDTRIKTLELLADLPPEDWQLPARHTIFGPTHLQELMNFTARHDRLHLRQINDLLAIP